MSSPPEFKSNNTVLLHEIRLLRSDIVRMLEDSAKVRTAMFPRSEHALHRRHLLARGAALFAVVGLMLALFFVGLLHSNAQAAKFEARVTQFQREAVSACEMRNGRLRNDQAFAAGLLKILATAAANPQNKARNPAIEAEYVATVSAYKNGLGSTVDCAKQRRLIGH